MAPTLTRSARLFEEAQRHLPGGVNSPVRAFHGVGGTPVFVDRAQGNRIWDVDGNEYVDYVCSWGPLIAGHAHPRVVEAVSHAAAAGTSFGAPTELEVDLARRVVDAVPFVAMMTPAKNGVAYAVSAVIGSS